MVNTKRRSRNAGAFASKALRVARALTGEPCGIVVDTQTKTVTVTVVCEDTLEPRTVLSVLPTVCVEGSQWAQASLSSHLADRVVVTFAADKDHRKVDVSEVVAQAELRAPEILATLTSEGIGCRLAADSDIAEFARQVWPDSSSTAFPPHSQGITMSERFVEIEGRTITAFDVLADDYEAVEQIVNAVEWLDVQSMTHLAFRPFESGEGGRFAIAIVLSANNQQEVENASCVLVGQLPPRARLRMRRAINRVADLNALGLAAGVGPWEKE